MNEKDDMKRKHRLAADIFGYSYFHYQDHLGGHERFDHIMPDDAETLEKALKEKWSLQRVAREIEIDVKDAPTYLEAAEKALEIANAENLAESFRVAVRHSVEKALEEGLESPKSIDELVKQICYNAADFGFRLDEEGQRLSQYSRNLRREPNVGYPENYFTERFKVKVRP
ncbi:MAG: hypothetical protein GY859_22930 [Desulfobacterales bacterium]|nr:hypothetical protein [Desulfobacterales bacterium]